MIGASGGGGFFLLIIVAFGFLWFMLIRPQKRRQVQQQRMLSDLKEGDEIVTAGGIYGEITRVEEDGDVMVRIAPELEVKVARRAIGGVVEKPTEDAGSVGGEAADARHEASAAEGGAGPETEEQDATLSEP